MRTSDCGPVRPSGRSRWRALVLIAVYLLAAAHYLHWKLAGTTLTPVEPSEAMQTLGVQAIVNTGFVLFALLILSTFIFGRFFCGWGCHIVALQDWCTWLMRKAGVPARPFRSRLLVFVPLLAAIWMFVLPTVVRLWAGQARAPFRSGFFTNNLWERFPSWPIALLTFAVCGFLIVYLLGNKGFCTYACPYGGFFAIADRFAPGRIRVTEACEGCGHCTATCTSNVRVHEEVRLFKMVVDAGCMKCMDCISVCPKDALYFGFGPTALAKGKPSGPVTERVHDYSWPEEIAMAGLFAISIVVLRGLYDRIPFLLALGLAAISAAALLNVARIFYVKDVRFARFQMRRGGRLQPAGFSCLAAALLWGGFLTEAGVSRMAAYEGNRRLDAQRERSMSQGVDRTAVQGALGLLDLGRKLTLVPMARIEAGIAEAHELLSEPALAEPHYRRAIELAPDYSEGHLHLARLLAARGAADEATALLREAIAAQPDSPEVAVELSDLLVSKGDLQEAARLLQSQMDRHSDNASVRLAYDVVLARQGDVERAIADMRRLTDESPDFAEAHLKLGMLLAHQEQYAEALAAFERVIALQPASVPALSLASLAAVKLGRADLGLRRLESAWRLDPFNAQIVGTWAALVARTDGLVAAIGSAERASRSDRAARFRLLFLYRAAGRQADAARLAPEFSDLAPAR